MDDSQMEGGILDGGGDSDVRVDGFVYIWTNQSI